jgi:hypothetical protein
MTSVACFSCENISLIKTCIGLEEREREVHRHVEFSSKFCQFLILSFLVGKISVWHAAGM